MKGNLIHEAVKQTRTPPPPILLVSNNEIHQFFVHSARLRTIASSQTPTRFNPVPARSRRVGPGSASLWAVISMQRTCTAPSGDKWLSKPGKVTCANEAVATQSQQICWENSGVQFATQFVQTTICSLLTNARTRAESKVNRSSRIHLEP